MKRTFPFLFPSSHSTLKSTLVKSARPSRKHRGTPSTSHHLGSKIPLLRSLLLTEKAFVNLKTYQRVACHAASFNQCLATNLKFCNTFRSYLHPNTRNKYLPGLTFTPVHTLGCFYNLVNLYLKVYSQSIDYCTE